MNPAAATLLGALVLLGAMPTDALAARKRPAQIRLVLQVTVDGLRGDLLNRCGDRLGDDGFRYLLDHGAVFADARYQHANTETIVGHTVLATGSFPRDHGMVGNLWFDRESGEQTYNIEDPDYPLLPSRDNAAKGAQVDPAQKAARTDGRSPRVIRGTTFSDELASHTAGRAKIFAVSGKDRGAVPLAGHSGKAFWFSTDSGDFVTSRFYYDAYPVWVSDWNARRQAEDHADTHWRLLHEQRSYLFGDRDDRPYEIDLKGYGRTFPHPFGPVDHPLFHTRLLVSPVGDRLTADFARTILSHEGLGQDEVPDYLSVSFSGVDAVNHFFGPSSLESEDVLLQLDRTLATLLSAVDKQVGLKHVLIALAADHGMAEMPEAMAEMGHGTGRIYSEQITAAANAAGKRHFGVEGLVRLFYRPYLYLNDEVLAEAKLDRDTVAEALADDLVLIEGIAMAVPRSRQSDLTAPGPLGRIQRNFHPERSGDIYLAQDPYWFLYEKGAIAVMHGSPWAYDTFVPIIFAGPGIRSQTIHRRVHPVDVAATLAARMGTKPPAGSRGHPLPEVLNRATR